MFKFSNYRISSQTWLFFIFLLTFFQVKSHYVKAEIFKPNQFIINVYAYTSNNHTLDRRRGMRTAKVYLETLDGRRIKFCPEGNGRYVSNCPGTTGEFNLEKDQYFMITITHNTYRDRTVNFLRYPFDMKGRQFTFYLFRINNYFIDGQPIPTYHEEGLSLFCNLTQCNRFIDRTVSYYELVDQFVANISDITTRKNILYNLGRAKYRAWKYLHYDTCKQAYNSFSQVSSLLDNTDTDDEIRLLLEDSEFMMKDEDGIETTIKPENEFCKRVSTQ